MDSIQGRVLLRILMELKEEYTLRVEFQQESRKNLCYRCGKVEHFIHNFNQAKMNGLVHQEGNDGKTRDKCNH